MATGLRAGNERRSSSLLLRTAVVAFVAAGVLAMHAFTGGFNASADHTDMAHSGMSDMATSSVLTPAATTTAIIRDHHGSHSTDEACGLATMCLALVAGGLLLLIAGRAPRPFLARRRVEASLSRLRLLALARLPDPPDLHALSILRC